RSWLLGARRLHQARIQDSAHFLAALGQRVWRNPGARTHPTDGRSRGSRGARLAPGGRRRIAGGRPWPPDRAEWITSPATPKAGAELVPLQDPLHVVEEG